MFMWIHNRNLRQYPLFVTIFYFICNVFYHTDLDPGQYLCIACRFSTEIHVKIHQVYML